METYLRPLPVEILNDSDLLYSDIESFVDESSTDSWSHDEILDMATTCTAQTLCDSLPGCEIDDSLSMYDKTDFVKERKESIMDEDFELSEKSFNDISSHSTIMLDSYNQEYDCQSDSDSFKSWTEKHPDSWSSSEVKDWIFTVASEHGLDFSRVHTENFSTVTGLHLSRFELKDFLDRDPDYGSIYHSIFKQLSSGVRFIPPANLEHGHESNEVVTYNVPSEEILRGLITQTPSEMETDQETSRMLDNNLQTLLVCSDGVTKVNINDHWYDIDSNIDVMATTESFSLDQGYESGDSGESPIHVTNVPNDLFLEEDDHCLPVNKSTSPKKKSSNRRVNSSSSESGVEEDIKSNRGRKPGQSSKGNHLWEFIRDLLKDSNYNPSLLRWEDKDTGVFRFVQSEAVAQMWGKKKNNPGMTYEKLSRAMRFCRTAGYFAGVPKNGKYPKKLCFRFGPKSFGWETV